MATHEILGAPFLYSDIFSRLPIISINGNSKSGKGTATQMLEDNLGIKHIATMSDFIKDRLQKVKQQSPPFDRWQLGNETNEYHILRGTKDVWARFALHKIGKTHLSTPLVGASMDGFRYVEECMFLKEFSNTLLIYLEVSLEERISRAQAEARPGELINPIDFAQRDKVEMKQMLGMREMSDLVLRNDGEPQQLELNLVKFVANHFNL